MTDDTTLDKRIAAARKAVTDECGSRLCSWADLGTERVCTRDDGRSFCFCENAARAAVMAADAVDPFRDGRAVLAYSGCPSAWRRKPEDLT